MKKMCSRLLLGVLLLALLTGKAAAADLLVPVGQVVGLELHNNTVTVVSFEEGSCAQTAGMKAGDQILRIDDTTITCAQDVRKALDQSNGSVKLTFLRGDDLTTVRLEPTITPEGPKLGLFLRQGVTGIGTVTYYDPETKAFGTLGHGVNDPSGALLQLTTGNAYQAAVTSVRKGKCGEPGQLMGTLTSQTPLGDLRRNTVQGVFGTLSVPIRGQAIPVGSAETVKTGSATIRSTITGDTPQEYSVEILKIYPATRLGGRNMLIRVTDPALLETTGGIVQGMSGSPIIQNGKLVGAVTHVLVNDPTTGYGIFIENMLDAAA